MSKVASLIGDFLVNTRNYLFGFLSAFAAFFLLREVGEGFVEDDYRTWLDGLCQHGGISIVPTP